tara:strand:- start:1412 stop:1852 length:441 start_codon:yes stop_codon:yes gene_type:complete
MRNLLLLFIVPLSILGQNKSFNMDYFNKLNERERSIIVDKGTEAPFSGEYNDFFEKGYYVCRACETPLYRSSSKFNSRCGWPAFDDEIENAIIKKPDNSYNMERIEICCANCNGHLGHVFYGEKYTDKNTRHCVNSLSLRFVPHKK